MSSEVGDEPGSDKRRLATARWTVDQPDPKRSICVGLFDASLPEVDGFGEPVGSTVVGKQFEEEVFVLGIERPKTPRDDLDCGRFDDILAGLVLRESQLAQFCPTLAP